MNEKITKIFPCTIKKLLRSVDSLPYWHFRNLSNIIIYIDNNLITEISGLDNLVNLEHLDLRYNQISEIQGYSNLTKLERLYISSNRLRDRYIEDLEGLAQLETL